MLKISDVVKVIEDFAPLDLQMEYDNCGLLYGDLDWVLKGVLVTLDTTPEVIKEAIKVGANMIIEHHPSIFNAIKKIDLSYPKHKAITMAIKNDIAIYSAHTTVDFTKGGLNDYVMQLLGCSTYELAFGNACDMRVGKLPSKVSLAELVDIVSKKFDDSNVTYVGNKEQIIETIAVINGGGGSHEETILEAKKAGADVFISGDFKYNVLRLAKDINYPIISLGHYTSELPFIKLITNILQNKNIYNVHGATSCMNPLN